MVFGYVMISTKNSYEHEVANKLSLIEEAVDVELACDFTLAEVYIVSLCKVC